MMFHWGGWGWTRHGFVVGRIFLSLFCLVIGMIYSWLFLVTISGWWNRRGSHCIRRRRGSTSSFIIGFFTRGHCRCRGHGLILASFGIDHLTHWEKTVWRYLFHNLISWMMMVGMLNHYWINLLKIWKIWRASSEAARGCHRIEIRIWLQMWCRRRTLVSLNMGIFTTRRRRIWGGLTIEVWICLAAWISTCWIILMNPMVLSGLAYCCCCMILRFFATCEAAAYWGPWGPH